MAVDPGIGFAVVLNGILLLLGVLAYAYWQLHGGQSAPPEESVEEWYESAALLAREVQQVAAPSNAPIPREKLRRQVVPLSNRLQGHARSAPEGVDEQLVKDLYDLGMDCYKLGMEHTRREATQTGVFVEDKLSEIRTDAADLEMAVSLQTDQSE